MTRLATAAVLAALAMPMPAASVISNFDPSTAPYRHMAWGENVGWINFRGQGTGDAATPPPVFGINAVAGFAWGENIGWVNLGDGTNTDPNAFGVIVNPGDGFLSGYAWGENVGWINFGTNFGVVPMNERPHVDLGNGRLAGYAWGENIGWINLGTSFPVGVDPVTVVAPTASQIANGLIALTPVPLFSDRQPDGAVDAADVVRRVNDGFP